MNFLPPGYAQGINQSMAIDREQVAAKQLQAQRQQSMDYQNFQMQQETRRNRMADEQMAQQRLTPSMYAPAPAPNPGEASVSMQPPPGAAPQFPPMPGGMGPPQQQDQQVPAYRNLQSFGQNKSPPIGGQQQDTPPPIGGQQQTQPFPSHQELEQRLTQAGVSDPMIKEQQHVKLQKMMDDQLSGDVKRATLAKTNKELAEVKAPQTRNVFNGAQETQQELVNGKWQTYGAGPRFAKPAVMGGGTGGASVGVMAGDIESVPKADRATVKAISEGRQKLSDVGYRGADRKRLMDMVNAYNPTYNPESNKSSQVARTNTVKDLAAIRPFKEMLDTNINVAIDLSRKIIATDSKYANRPLNWIKQNTGDNPDTADYLAQMTFVQTEAARVLNNPRLVGQLTDSARHEMQEVVDGSMPLKSLERVLTRIKLDGQNRVAAMVKEKLSLDRDIAGSNDEAKPSAASSNSKGWKLMTDAKGNKAYVSPDGKNFEEVK